MPRFELVQRMALAPGRCMTCGCGHVEDEHGKVGPFVDLGVEYNWGDSCYLCLRCAELVAGLIGWMPESERKDLEKALEAKDREIHDTRAKLELKGRQYEAAQTRLQNIANGLQETRRMRREKVTAK